MSQLEFHRQLKLTSPTTKGYDVEGLHRAVLRLLDDGDKWTAFVDKPSEERRTFGMALRRDLIAAQKKLTAGKTPGVLDAETLHALEDAGAFDTVAKGMWRRQYAHLPVELVYPYPVGEGGGICQGLHPTAGLPGNWAIDFCDTPGARVVAVEAGMIDRLSGHPPSQDTWDTMGVFGWTTYLLTPAGYRYFITHLGWRDPTLLVGTHVLAGKVLGKVGDQKFRPDHCHYGVTSPLGEADAKKRITAVSVAQRVGGS